MLLTSRQKLRERLSLNEKILVDVDKYPLISSKLAAGRRMEVNITLISASDSSVVAELHEASLVLSAELATDAFDLFGIRIWSKTCVTASSS